jgi:hypothetical protein
MLRFTVFTFRFTEDGLPAGAAIKIKKKRIPIIGSDVATGWLFASVPEVLRKNPSDPAVNYHVFGIDEFVVRIASCAP